MKHHLGITEMTDQFEKKLKNARPIALYMCSVATKAHIIEAFKWLSANIS